MSYLPVTLLVGSIVFVPLLIIAIVRFKSTALAFALAAAFAIGAMAGLYLSLFVGSVVLPVFPPSDLYLIMLFVFGTAGSVGGASLALWLLRRIAGNSNWERR
jgi:hypothetical protein